MEPRSASHRILIVDDNPAIHGDFRKVLTPSGPSEQALDAMAADLFGRADEPATAQELTLDSAHQGQEALALVQQAVQEGQPYALAFVDVRMPPGWDGIETVEQLWKVDPCLQVVICTAYSDYSWAQMLARLGTSDRLLILKKPFDTIEVAQLALSLTSKWSAEHQVRAHVAELETTVRARTAEVERANADLRAEMERRERAEGELRLSQKLEAVGRLAAGVAHEINNPAQCVSHNIEFLEEALGRYDGILLAHDAIVLAAEAAGVAGAERDALAELAKTAGLGYLRGEVPIACAQALDAIHRISRTIGALLEFAQAGSGRKAMTDIGRAIESAVTVSENHWKHVADLDLDLEDGIVVPCHAGELKDVVLGLVLNAAQAMFAGAGQGRRGVLTVRTRVDGPWAVIEVRDTGAGIPEDIRDRIFDPFFTTAEVGRGMGQGLAIARSIVVERHGGSIKFETTKDKGTTFFVRLPLVDPLAKAA